MILFGLSYNHIFISIFGFHLGNASGSNSLKFLKLHMALVSWGKLLNYRIRSN